MAICSGIRVIPKLLAMRRLNILDSTIPGLCPGHAAASGPTLTPLTGSLAKASQSQSSEEEEPFREKRSISSFQVRVCGAYPSPIFLPPAPAPPVTTTAHLGNCVSPLYLDLQTQGRGGR